MALMGVNQPGWAPRGPSTFEKVIGGLDAASKVLGLGLTGVQLYQKSKEIGQNKSLLDLRTRELDVTEADKLRPLTKDDTAKGITGAVLPESRVYPGVPVTAREHVNPYDAILGGFNATIKGADAKKAADESKHGKPLPQAMVDTLAEGRNIPSQLQKVNTALEKNGEVFGPFEGRVRGANPYDTKAQTVQSVIYSTKQLVGKFLEGGVLRKEDEGKYEKILPNLNDSLEVAKNKQAIIYNLVTDKFNNYLTDMKNAGYDTRGFEKHPLQSMKMPVFLTKGQVKNLQEMTSTEAGLQPGHIEDGHRYKGGNPADPINWEIVK